MPGMNRNLVCLKMPVNVLQLRTGNQTLKPGELKRASTPSVFPKHILQFIIKDHFSCVQLILHYIVKLLKELEPYLLSFACPQHPKQHLAQRREAKMFIESESIKSLRRGMLNRRKRQAHRHSILGDCLLQFCL